MKNKAHDLRDLAVEELENRVREKSEELMNLRLQHNMRALDNPLKVRQTRREIAVLKTVINQKKGAR
jgi:large subunit ribosomal protein L29